ncbi:MAG: metal-dependent transcriptional regulator [Patulibacter sp.]
MLTATLGHAFRPSPQQLVPFSPPDASGDAPHPCVPTTGSVARYLLAIFEVSRDQPRLTVTAVARRLGVSTPSAHEMIGRLERLGLVERHPLALTADGTSAALVLNTRLRATRRLAAEVLGMDVLADDEAHTLAASLPPEIGRRLSDWHARRSHHDAE